MLFNSIVFVKILLCFFHLLMNVWSASGLGLFYPKLLSSFVKKHEHLIFWWLLESWMAPSSDKCMTSILRICQYIFQSAFTTFHSLKQWVAWSFSTSSPKFSVESSIYSSELCGAIVLLGLELWLLDKPHDCTLGVNVDLIMMCCQFFMLLLFMV